MTPTIDTKDWKPTTDVGYGLTSLEILGVPHHVEMIEVERCTHEDCSGPGHWCDHNTTVDPGRQEQVESVYTALGGDGPWRCVEIEGRDYIIIITPFCD